MYELEARCPCCAAPLVATVTVEDTGGDPQRGHDYDVGLALSGPEPIHGHGQESCVICENPFTTAGERLACEAHRRRTA